MIQQSVHTQTKLHLKGLVLLVNMVAPEESGDAIKLSYKTTTRDVGGVKTESGQHYILEASISKFFLMEECFK